MNGFVNKVKIRWVMKIEIHEGIEFNSYNYFAANLRIIYACKFFQYKLGTKYIEPKVI